MTRNGKSNDTGVKRVALYCRVSTGDQTDKGTIQGQVDFLRNYVKLYEISVADSYLDDGWSGAIPLPDRPEGRRLLEDARNGLFQEVLVYRLDRLGRSLLSLVQAHDLLDGLGVTIKSATEPFDTSNAIGRFMFQLLASLAELERETINERMTMGRNRVAKQGKWTAGPIPFGYDLDDSGHLIPSTRLVEGLEITESQIVRDIFTHVAEGRTAVDKAAALNSLGVLSVRRYLTHCQQQDEPAWDTSRVCDLIHNPLYKGVRVINSYQGRIETEAPALVSVALWEAAQQALIKNRKMAKKNATHDYLLRGLIACEDCGGTYSGATTVSMKKGPTQYQYYRCSGQAGAKAPTRRCQSKLLPLGELEDTVWQHCREYIFHPDKALAEAQTQLRERLGQSAKLESRRQTLSHQLAQKNEERERIMTLFRRGRATLTEVEGQLDALAVETASIRQQLEVLQGQQDVAGALEAHLSSAAALLARLRGRVEEIERTNDRKLKREIIETLVRGIRVKTEGEGRNKQAHVTIHYAFGEPAVVVDSPTSGSRRDYRITLDRQLLVA